MAGRTAQEFNQRKQRKGAFWEDHYHATAVERNEHLIRCLVYIDLNMVRAGVVNHPSEWEMSGCNEIQHPPTRYGVIDLSSLRNLCGLDNSEEFSRQHRQWVQAAVENGRTQRESCWTDSIAVGRTEFVEETKVKLGIMGKGRRIESLEADRCSLKEEWSPYSAVFDPKIEPLSPKKRYFGENDREYSAT